MDPNNPKKSDLKPDTLYFVCPDSSCRKFYNTSIDLACENKCPRQEELIKFRYCDICDQIIEGDFPMGLRTTHNCIDGPLHWFGVETYGLVYKKPE